MTLIPFEDPEDFPRIEKRVRRLLEEGTTFVPGHAAQRMKERGITMVSVQAVLRAGRIVDHQAATEGPDFWRYVFEGRDTNAKRLRIVVEVNGKLIVVSAIDL